MQNRVVLSLLIAASVAFARGSFANDANKPLASRQQSADDKEVLGTTFNIVRPSANSAALKFALRVVNNTTRMVEIHFPDGQTHDFVVTDSAGKEVWRWSDGRMFTQAMKSKTLKGKDDTVFEEVWDTEGHHGAFTAVATLKSENYPVETTVQFELP